MCEKSLFKEKLLFFASYFTNEATSCKSKELIMQHSFVYSISILIPGVAEVPRNLVTNVDNLQYFTVSQLKLKTVVEAIFIEAFIKKGSLSIMAVNKRLHAHSTFCILPTGVLILNLLKEHYECLGLEGKASKLSKKYLVRVDLKALKLNSNKHQRLLFCLAKFTDSFDVVFNWNPLDSQTDNRSVQAYMLGEGYLCQEIQVMVNEKTKHNISVPTLQSQTLSHPDTFLQWLGAVTCQCSFGGENCYENSIKSLQPSTQFDNLAVINLSGFFPNFIVENIFSNLRSFLKNDKESNIPWISVSLHGFQDSAVSWGECEHFHNMTGDNSHTLVLFPDANFSFFNQSHHAFSI